MNHIVQVALAVVLQDGSAYAIATGALSFPGLPVVGDRINLAYPGRGAPNYDSPLPELVVEHRSWTPSSDDGPQGRLHVFVQDIECFDSDEADGFVSYLSAGFNFDVVRDLG